MPEKIVKLADNRRAARAWALPKWAYAIGLLAIVVALAASGALAVQHLTGVTLPGCGGVVRDTGGLSFTGIEEAKPACASLGAHPLGSLGGMVYGVRAIMAKQPVGKIPAEHAWWPVSFLGTAYFAGAFAAWIAIGGRGRVLSPGVRAIVWLGALAAIGYLVVIVLEKKYCQYCIASHIANLGLLAAMELGVRSRSSTESAS